MFKNYFKTALRSLYKNKVFTLINVLGLSIGIAMAVLLARFIQVELSYDQHFESKDRIYRVYQESKINGRERINISGSGLMGPTLESSFPEIEIAGRSHRVGSAVIVQDDNRFIENTLAYADEGLLDILEVRFLEGSPSLSEPSDMVISETLAQKVFGTTSGLIGQTIKVDDKTLRVTGVFRDQPKNSHYSPRSGFISNSGMNMHSWTRVGHLTYVRLLDQTSPDVLEDKFAPIVNENILPVLPEDSEVTLKLYPVTKIWLSESEGLNGGGNKKALISFALIAFFILLIASINYINLATARSMRRVKEIGMRKVIGAKKSHLIAQFLLESVILCLISIFTGGFLAEICTGLFNGLTGKEIEIGFLQNPNLLGLLICFGFLLGLLSGLYPAIYISSFRPTRILKSSSTSNKLNRNIRRALVTIQFAISIGLIVSTMVVYNQTSFLLDKDLGYDSEQVFSIRLAKADTSEIIKRQIGALPSVTGVSATNLLPATGDSGATFLIDDEDGEEHRDVVSMASVDHDYLSMMKYRLLLGRDFRSDLATDQYSIIVNQTLVKKYGWKDPLGKEIKLGFGEGPNAFTIIGVVEDFNMLSLYHSVKPFAFFLKPQFDWGAQYLFVRVSADEAESTITKIRDIYGSVEKDRPFNGLFIDDYFSRVYESESKKGQVYFTFSILAIVVACIGLFGLASFVLQQKIKEISIRKVLGASLGDIVLLVSREFIFIILLSTLIASPLAYYFMQDWLQSFEYSIKINLGIFLISGLTAVIVAIITISIQSLKTAKTNPAETLKYE